MLISLHFLAHYFSLWVRLRCVNLPDDRLTCVCLRCDVLIALIGHSVSEVFATCTVRCFVLS